MISDKIRLYTLFIKFLIPYALSACYRRVKKAFHRWTYKAVDVPLNVVVLGGSYAGVELCRRLTESLPTGYRVVLIEKNSHFNYTFNFPRYSVLKGHERRAFIPYDGICRHAPAGIFQRVCDTATMVTEHSVHLASGEEIPFVYLAIATGSWQPSPARLQSTTRDGACAELQGLQEAVESAQNIAVIGGGAVGVELSSDIKSYYPEKSVSLIHSREKLLPRFGPRLHDYTTNAFNKLGINAILGERPHMTQNVDSEKSQHELHFSDGQSKAYDLVIPCTGQRPQSEMIKSLSPESVCNENGHITVQPSLQIHSIVNKFDHIFALGDVADTGGPKMARAGHFQAKVVCNNILDLIRGRNTRATYEPQVEIEGVIKLTLGKGGTVIYTMYADGTDILVHSNKWEEDLEVERAWKMYGASLKDA